MLKQLKIHPNKLICRQYTLHQNLYKHDESSQKQIDRKLRNGVGHVQKATVLCNDTISHNTAKALPLKCGCFHLPDTKSSGSTEQP